MEKLSKDLGSPWRHGFEAEQLFVVHKRVGAIYHMDSTNGLFHLLNLMTKLKESFREFLFWLDEWQKLWLLFNAIRWVWWNAHNDIYISSYFVSFCRVLEVGSCFEVRLSRNHCSSWGPAHWASAWSPPIRQMAWLSWGPDHNGLVPDLGGVLLCLLAM